MRPTNCDVPAMDQIHMRSPISRFSKCYSSAANDDDYDCDDDDDDDNNDDTTTPIFTVDK